MTRGELRSALGELERELPDFAGTAAGIATVRSAPVTLRIDYQQARSAALAAFGTTTYGLARASALEAKERVLRAVAAADLPSLDDAGPIHVIVPGSSPPRSFCGVDLDDAAHLPPAEITEASWCAECVRVQDGR